VNEELYIGNRLSKALFLSGIIFIGIPVVGDNDDDQ